MLQKIKNDCFIWTSHVKIKNIYLQRIIKAQFVQSKLCNCRDNLGSENDNFQFVFFYIKLQVEHNTDIPIKKTKIMWDIWNEDLKLCLLIMIKLYSVPNFQLPAYHFEFSAPNIVIFFIALTKWIFLNKAFLNYSSRQTIWPRYGFSAMVEQ